MYVNNNVKVGVPVEIIVHKRGVEQCNERYDIELLKSCKQLCADLSARSSCAMQLALS